MKISTSMGYAVEVAGSTYAVASRMMKQAGFEGIDLGMYNWQETPEQFLTPQWREDKKAMANAAKDAGLEISQCHLPYYGGHLPLPGDGSYKAYEDFMLPMYERALEVCGEIGCHTAVMHPFFKTGDPDLTLEGNLCTVEKVMPLLKEYDIRLALENVYGKNYASSHMTCAEEILRVLEKCDGDWVGACINTGHANIFGVHIGNMARKLQGRLFALHINGNAGKDEHLIPYTSSSWCELMDYRDFTAALHEIGYDGWYNLEIACGDLPECAIEPFYTYAAAVARGLSSL